MCTRRDREEFDKGILNDTYGDTRRPRAQQLQQSAVAQQ
jgi:hypothetical protein